MKTSRNPYIREDGVPMLQRSVVAFIDMLGYAHLVQGLRSSSERQTLLTKLHGALRNARKHVNPNESPSLGLGKKDFSAFRAFTDNIVIGRPIGTDDDGEGELGSLFFELSYFQMMMTIEGFFIRGGIAIGDLYIDDIAVFGSGLIEAYEAETNLARDPRIVLGRSAKDAVDRHLEYYGRGSHAPQNRVLLKDSDGQYFVNYLDTLMSDEGVFYQEELGVHKKTIEEKLTSYREQPPIWSKYLWAANYHNYFCDEHSYLIDASDKVKTDQFIPKPSRLIP